METNSESFENEVGASSSDDLIDDDPVRHLQLTQLIASGDFEELEVEEVVNSSKSRREVYEKLLAIKSRRQF